MTTTLTTILIALVAVALALLLAYVPLRMLVALMAKKIIVFIERQRERRAVVRETPDRRRG
jgi:hypothetical protein